MQQKNANAKAVFVLAAVILLAGIALTALFLAQPPPGESDRSAPLPAEDQGAPENSARTEKGVSPLLLILIFIVVLAATTKIGRMLARGKAKGRSGVMGDRSGARGDGQ